MNLSSAGVGVIKDNEGLSLRVSWVLLCFACVSLLSSFFFKMTPLPALTIDSRNRWLPQHQHFDDTIRPGWMMDVGCWMIDDGVNRTEVQLLWTHSNVNPPLRPHPISLVVCARARGWDILRQTPACLPSSLFVLMFVSSTHWLQFSINVVFYFYFLFLNLPSKQFSILR